MSAVPAQLQAAIEGLEALPDPSARALAREAVAGVLELHADALRRLSGRIRAMGAAGEQLLQAAMHDDVIASVLSLHDLDAEHREVTRTQSELIPLTRRSRRAAPDHERCGLCGEALPPDHDHLYDVERRKLECACTACGLLFDAKNTKVKRVRRSAVALTGFRISDEQWDALKVPVGLAFFTRSSSMGEVVAAYPGPAGAVSSVVSSSAWHSLVEANPRLAALEEDTCALLVDRLSAQPSYHVVSIDECYRLTGIVRSRWQGMTGGDGPAQAVREFFAALPRSEP